MGIHLTSFTNSIRYKTENSKKVTAIIATKSYYYNIFPFILISKHSEDRYIYANKAHNSVVYNVSPPAYPWGTVDNIHNDVIGFANGKSTYRIYH